MTKISIKKSPWQEDSLDTSCASATREQERGVGKRLTCTMVLGLFTQCGICVTHIKSIRKYPKIVCTRKKENRTIIYIYISNETLSATFHQCLLLFPNTTKVFSLPFPKEDTGERRESQNMQKKHLLPMSTKNSFPCRLDFPSL